MNKKQKQCVICDKIYDPRKDNFKKSKCCSKQCAFQYARDVKDGKREKDKSEET